MTVNENQLKTWKDDILEHLDDAIARLERCWEMGQWNDVDEIIEVLQYVRYHTDEQMAGMLNHLRAF